MNRRINEDVTFQSCGIRVFFLKRHPDAPVHGSCPQHKMADFLSSLRLLNIYVTIKALKVP